MEQKSLVTLLYVLGGLLLGSLPLLPRLIPALRAPLASDPREGLRFTLWLLALVGLVNGNPHLGLLAVCALLAWGVSRVCAADGLSTTASTTAALFLGSTLLWWRRPEAGLQLTIAELVSDAVISATVLWLLLRSGTPGPAARAARTRNALLGAYLLAAAWLCFTTFAIEQGGAALTAWHHWGAYIGPAELLLSGAHLFTDFPAQYGLGPTLLVAAQCGSDCWSGFYVLAGCAALGYAALLALLLQKVLDKAVSAPVEATLLALMFCCSLLWTSLPSALATPLLTPSTTGLRFLPALLVALCAWDTLAQDSRRTRLLGHLAWLTGMLWSPESAFYCTFVWWPTLTLRAFATCRQPPLTLLALQALRLLALLGGAVLLFAVACRTAFGEWPDPKAVFAYVLYPPGPLPVALNGALLFALAVFALGSVQLVAALRAADAPEAGAEPAVRQAVARAFVPMLLAFATWSYFLLGRSHDNNLLNLSPFLLLVLASVLREARHVEWKLSAAALAGSFAGWLVVFNFAGWQAALEQGRLFDFRPGAVLAHFSFDDPHMRQVLGQSYGKIQGDPAELRTLLNLAQGTAPGPYSVITSAMTLPRTAPDAAWNGMEAAETYAFLPLALRTEFLRRTAVRLHRCGWLVIDRAYLDGYQGYPSKVEWLASYDSVYTPDRQLQFGSFLGFHLVPKGQAGCAPAPGAPSHR